MALKQIIQLSGKSFVQTNVGPIATGDQDIELDCYVKVVDVAGGKESAQARVRYASGLSMFERFFDFTPSVADDAANFIEQAYVYLKTLPEFADAVDC